MNRATIAATKCENRFVPKSCCKGSCYLTKQLKADEQQQESPYNSGSKEKFEVLWCQDKQAGFTAPLFADHLQHKARYIVPVPYNAVSAIFHPPCV